MDDRDEGKSHIDEPPPLPSHPLTQSTYGSTYHVPVLLAEILELLQPEPGQAFLDATLGGGGHSEALARHLIPGGTLVALDRDTDALQAAGARLAMLTQNNAQSDAAQPEKEPATRLQNFVSIILLHTAFGNMETALITDSRTRNLKFHGILFDLGVSSHQLDTERGFSFRRDELLDMRMDRSSGRSVAELLQEEPQEELERILHEYGEERWARRIAQRMVERRQRSEPLETTAQLAELVEQAIPRKAWPRDIHVATRTFQGLRIAVNAELEQLRTGLEAAITRLLPGGRIAVISYHSLEDRIVKQTFAAAAGTLPSAPGSSPAAFLAPQREPTVDILTRKPVGPTDAEIAQNPRSRSAKLRAIVKL